MLETPIAAMHLLHHEQEAIHDLFSTSAELPVKAEGMRYFLESDFDSGRLEIADESDLQISSSNPAAARAHGLKMSGRQAHGP